MHTLYNIFIRIYALAITLAAVFNKKARQWKSGRKNILENIALTLDHEKDHVWFHCASLGEFEQGRPVIEKFRKDNPDIKIVLTFYSPSGYEVRKNVPLADHVFYMPLDTPYNAQKFVEYVKPRMAVFVKYEYWFNHLKTLHENKIPVVYISAIFRKKQMYFRWWGRWFKKQLSRVTYFFVQDKTSRELLYSIGMRNAVTSGDTRFDRVFSIRNNPVNYEKVEKFIQGSIIFIGGSTWPADDQLLVPLINKYQDKIKFILAPHEINESYIDKLCNTIEAPAVKYSSFNEEQYKEAAVLIIDQIGMLSNLYQYASVAYIGGGFGKGIHNILEAATFGMPVIFGPRHQKFTEARELIKYGGAFSIQNKKELDQLAVKLLGDYNTLKSCSQISKEYVNLKKGATDTIVVFLNTIIKPGGYKAQALDLLNMN